MQKNVAGQKWRVFAFDRTTQAPKTGDAANITAVISIDGAAAVQTNDVNPTEISKGFYQFNLTQAETNGYELLIIPSSETVGIQVIGAPATVATTPVAWPTDVVQTGDSFNRIGAAGVSLTSLGDIRIANLDATISSRLAPTVSGRTLDVTVTGEAGIDWSNVSNPSSVLNLSGTTIYAAGGGGGDATLAKQNEILAAIALLSSVAGPGDDQVTITIEDDSVPVENVNVWISSDADGNTVIAGTVVTDGAGEALFLLTAGATYYLWAHKAGKIDIRGQSFVAVAD